jgi:hypothetical protein
VLVYYNVNGNHCTNSINESETQYFSGSAFPNPTTGKCIIPFRLNVSQENSSIVLFDLAGVKIYVRRLENTSGGIDIDLSFLPSGIYFYSLQWNENFSSFKKLIIAK